MYPIKVSKKYNQNDLENLGHIYTVPYLGNYEVGVYKENVGSHPGVDIIPESSNSNVFACLDGEIIKVGDDLSYGKHIFIKHENVPNPDNFSLKTTLYSCYEHLSNIGVEIGDKVSEGDIIGKTGNSGISSGEHLHFQIDRDTAPYHAYWPFSGQDVRDAGCSDFSQGVNLKLGYDNALKYTVNPLVYLDNLEGKIGNNTTVAKTTNDKNKIENKFDTNKTLDIEKTEVPLNVVKEIKNPESKIVILDLKSSDENYGFIQELIEKKVFLLDNSYFKSDNNITRGEFLKVIFLYNNIEISKNNEEYFLDVKAGYWQNKYINTAIEKEVISKNNEYFNPNEDISKIEALKIYSKLLKLELSEEQKVQISDIEGNDWKYKYALFGIEKGVFDLDDEKKFNDNSLTRYDGIKMLKLIK